MSLSLSAWTRVMPWTPVWSAGDLSPQAFSGFPSQSRTHGFLPNVLGSNTWPWTCSWKWPLSKSPLPRGNLHLHGTRKSALASDTWCWRALSRGSYFEHTQPLPSNPETHCESYIEHTAIVWDSRAFCLKGNGWKVYFRNNVKEERKSKTMPRREIYIEICRMVHKKATILFIISTHMPKTIRSVVSSRIYNAN